MILDYRQRILRYCACCLWLVASASWADHSATLEECRQQFPGYDDAQKAERLNCYDKIETGRTAGAMSSDATPAPLPSRPNASSQAKAIEERNQKPKVKTGLIAASCSTSIANDGYRLDAVWDSGGLALNCYKQDYVMVTSSDRLNQLPTSPNPVNQVTSPRNLRNDEIKFQFSLKLPILRAETLGHDNSLWFAYTQQSYWQFFDVNNSRPFRESNYEPELIFSHRLMPSDDANSVVNAMRIVNFGIVHQSNGQSDPFSRSWNRFYAQVGFEKKFDANSSDRLTVLVRPWVRFGNSNPARDNNPDIEHFLGHGDVELLYWRGDYLLSALGRTRSLQFDLSVPIYDNGLQAHFQYFTGHGESLIDYNQRHTEFGLGLSMQY